MTSSGDDCGVNIFVLSCPPCASAENLVVCAFQGDTASGRVSSTRRVVVQGGWSRSPCWKVTCHRDSYQGPSPRPPPLRCWRSCVRLVGAAVTTTRLQLREPGSSRVCRFSGARGPGGCPGNRIWNPECGLFFWSLWRPRSGARWYVPEGLKCIFHICDFGKHSALHTVGA